MRKPKTIITPRVRTKVKVTVLTDANASVAHAELYGFTRDELVIFETTGAAKRQQRDPRDQVIAVELAVGRALAKMSRQMLRAGQRRVDAATDAQIATQVRRRKRNGRARDATAGTMLSIPVIRERYGDEAAVRAAGRRKHSI